MPYYIAVAALYGVITWLTNSTLPAIVPHVSGNLYSSTMLWLTGHAEWQQSAAPEPLVWGNGADRAFWLALIVAVLVFVVTIWAYRRLAQAAKGRAAQLSAL
jgi:hypothetical protein